MAQVKRRCVHQEDIPGNVKYKLCKMTIIGEGWCLTDSDYSLCADYEEATMPEQKEDNWKHRAANMRCLTCMYWVQKLMAVGRCRRHSPTMSGWPVQFADDWCGDHKLDEGYDSEPD